mmetsp:Transcript_45296/g.114038  ORF Transcript_45296/g.114038 Transcript_45296/m.114038 type:complete len:260 (-) Transcript_45296:29-808(-)
MVKYSPLVNESTREESFEGADAPLTPEAEEEEPACSSLVVEPTRENDSTQNHELLAPPESEEVPMVFNDMRNCFESFCGLFSTVPGSALLLLVAVALFMVGVMVMPEFVPGPYGGFEVKDGHDAEVIVAILLGSLGVVFFPFALGFWLVCVRKAYNDSWWMRELACTLRGALLLSAATLLLTGAVVYWSVAMFQHRHVGAAVMAVLLASELGCVAFLALLWVAFTACYSSCSPTRPLPLRMFPWEFWGTIPTAAAPLSV